MFVKKLVGVGITTERVSVASLAVRSRSTAVCALWTTQLPAGCIDERTGSLQLSDMLVEVVRKIPVTLGLSCSSSRVSLVLPRQMFFTESWILTGEQNGAGLEAILAEAQRRLPGNPNEMQRACHWRNSSIAGHAPAAMMIAARCVGIEGYLAAMGACGVQLENVTSPAIARFNLLCLVHPESMNKGVVCVTVWSSVIEYEVWIGGVLVCERRTSTEALIAGFVVGVLQREGQGTSEHMEGGIQRLDYIAVFGDRCETATELGLESVLELCRVTGAEIVYPIECVRGEETANSNFNWSEPVGAVAPYCRHLGVDSFFAKVALP